MPSPRAPRTTPTFLRLLSLAGFLLIATACSMQVPKSTPPPDQAIPIPSGEFTVPASMNDTWNTVGQILVRTGGVTYESRAQMLGIYAVRYRGERFLIRTQAVVMDVATDGLRTRVLALELDGKPKQSAAANALLEVLKKRVPEEIGKYTLPIDWKGKPKSVRKKR